MSEGLKVWRSEHSSFWTSDGSSVFRPRGDPASSRQSRRPLTLLILFTAGTCPNKTYHGFLLWLETSRGADSLQVSLFRLHLNLTVMSLKEFYLIILFLLQMIEKLIKCFLLQVKRLTSCASRTWRWTWVRTRRSSAPLEGSGLSTINCGCRLVPSCQESCLRVKREINIWSPAQIQETFMGLKQVKNRICKGLNSHQIRLKQTWYRNFFFF